MGVPESPIPRVVTRPVVEILVGVVEVSVAVPPEILNAKSAATRAPEPPVVVYNVSLAVTATVLLFTESLTASKVGAILFIEAVLPV